MKRRFNLILAAGFGLLTAVPAFAGELSGLNIDFGSAAGARPGTYGAATDQVGVWTEVPNLPAALPVMLNGLDGAPSGVTVTSAVTITGFSFPNPDPTGDDAVLMNDGLNLGGPGTVSVLNFAGLENGTYTVYSYAWAPDGDDYRTNVGVSGSPSPAEDIGGAWVGFLEGTTHAVHEVDVTDGTLVVTVEPMSGFGTCNGMQIVPGGGEPDCPADFTSSAFPDVPDGIVGFADLLAILSQWGECEGCSGDLSGPEFVPDGIVGFPDLLVVLSAWGPCP